MQSPNLGPEAEFALSTSIPRRSLAAALQTATQRRYSTLIRLVKFFCKVQVAATIAFAIVLLTFTGCGQTLPSPNFSIGIGVTETQDGPDVCIDGRGFTPEGFAKLVYVNVPGPNPNRSIAIMHVDNHGGFSFEDSSQEGTRLADCTQAQVEQPVLISAMDLPTGDIASIDIPGAYWCANQRVPPDYNGGC